LPEAPVQQAAAPSYKVDGKEVEPTVIDELLKTTSKEELLAMNIQIENEELSELEKIIDNCTELNISEKIQMLLIQYELDVIKEKQENNNKPKIMTIGQKSMKN
jgi:hypothetical protein